ncbi:MAG: serine hydrolase [Acidimicrobiales bacterium]
MLATVGPAAEGRAAGRAGGSTPASTSVAAAVTPRADAGRAADRSDRAALTATPTGADTCVALFDAAETAWFEAWYGVHDVTAAVYDERTGCWYDLAPQRRNTTASVFKISMMARVLLAAQDAGRPLTAHEDQLIRPMITWSDNDSAGQLFSEFGGPAGMNAFYARVGMWSTSTVGWVWGADTRTSARDQVELMRLLLGDRPGVFTAYSRATALSYLAAVVPAQRWGVGAGLPPGWSFALKNGFYPSSCCGWRLNSVGRTWSAGGGYDVAVLTDQWGDEGSGIAAVEDVSRAINRRLASLDLGALPSGGPVGVNADGRLQAFGISPDGALFDAFQQVPGGAWSGWYPHDGAWPTTRQVSVTRNVDGRLELFALLADGRLVQSTQLPVGGGWTAPRVLAGSLAFGPAAGRSRDGRLEVFAVGVDGQLWHLWQTAPGGAWSPWTPMGGGLAGPPAVGTTADGRLVVGVVTGDGALVAAAQGVASGPWNGLVLLARGTATGGSARPAFGRHADGRLEVAVVGADTRLWHATQVGYGWTGLQLLSDFSFAQPPSMALNTDGRLELFGVERAGRLVRHAEDVPNGGWAGPSVLRGGLVAAPTLAADRDGRLEVFALGNGFALLHGVQAWPGGPWPPLGSLGGVFLVA